MCGVFGVFNHPEAANLTYLGLHALQHRGQESAGIVTSQGGTLHAVRKMGLVSEVFTSEVFAALPGRVAVGHVRYTTAGGSLPKNIQPLTAEARHSSIAVAHNGNLINAEQLRDDLEEDGAIFSSQSDTEVILQLMARSRANGFVERLIDALGRVRGAYSLVFTTDDRLIAARDVAGSVFSPPQDLPRSRFLPGRPAFSRPCRDFIAARLTMVHSSANPGGYPTSC